MLPATYQLPAAIVLLVGGIVACFFGYRLFRIVLAIFGFIITAYSCCNGGGGGIMLGIGVANCGQGVRVPGCL